MVRLSQIIYIFLANISYTEYYDNLTDLSAYIVYEGKKNKKKVTHDTDAAVRRRGGKEQEQGERLPQHTISTVISNKTKQNIKHVYEIFLTWNYLKYFILKVQYCM